MRKTVTYKTDTETYTIESYPRLLTDPDKWKIDIDISWEHDGGPNYRPFSVEVTSPPEKEAYNRGIHYGKCIIDGEVLGLSLNDPSSFRYVNPANLP